MRGAWLDELVTITVTDVPGRDRFEARDETDTLAGVLTYQLTGPIIAYTHTRVESEFESHGVGTALAQTAMDDARAKGRTVVPICPFLLTWLTRNPGYDDVVAPETRKMK